MSDAKDRGSASAALPRPPRRRRFWVLWLAIFLSGALIGTGVTLATLRHVVLSTVQHPERLPRRIASWLRGPLHLSIEQQQAVEAVFRERQHAIWAIRRQAQPGVEAELNRLREEVAAVLNAEQASKWAERFNRLRARWLLSPLRDGASPS